MEGLALDLVPAASARARAAHDLEYRVFNHHFGMTTQDFEENYAALETASAFVTVSAGGALVGCMRLSFGRTRDLKTMQDLASGWGADLDALEHAIPALAGHAVDIPTMAVLPEVPARTTYAVSGLLRTSAFALLLRLPGHVLTAVHDVPVLRAMNVQVGSCWDRFPGVGPAPYLGAPACLPSWTSASAIRTRASSRACEQAEAGLLPHASGVLPWAEWTTRAHALGASLKPAGSATE